MKEQEPLVTIRCITYNHEPYIRQCLEGFVMQKTNFKFEAIVHDDASTDKTADIVREYAEKYPDIIKPIYETENQYSKKNGSLTRIMNEHTRGKYIALCEGDDYWTDPLKLQKQVDFLEANPEYVLTCHRYKIYDYENNIWLEDGQDKFFKQHNKGVSFDYSLKHWITKTLTLVYRRDALSEYLEYTGKLRDTVLVYFLMKYGRKGYCFNDIMGVYRLSYTGVCGKQSLNTNVKNEYYILKDLYRHEKNNVKKRMYY